MISEETHLPHEHDRIAHAYYPRRANGCPYAYVIVMVLCGGPENPQITPQIGLRVRRHDAAQRRSHLHDPDALPHLKGPLQPVILHKTLDSRVGFDENIRAKAAGIELRIRTNQRTEMGERPACHDVHTSRIKERAQRQGERIG